MTTINEVIIRDQYDNFTEAREHMKEQGVKDLGWLNSGIVLPKNYSFTQVYCNKSGSSCLFVDKKHRVSYCVDMGD